MQIDLFTFIFTVVFMGASCGFGWYCYECGRRFGKDEVISDLVAHKIIAFDEQGNVISAKGK